MQFYQSNLLNNFSNITHVFTLRESGNLAFHVNDNILHVRANHDILAKELSYSLNSLIHMKQIHSDIVHIVNENDNFINPPTCDAIITDRLSTPLMVMVADCSPILFYDDKQRVIAVAHAGRAGAFKNIVKNVIYSFTDEFKSEVTNIHVSVGASIGSCCYEVGTEVYYEAKKLNLEYAIERKDNSFYLDISKILKKQFLACGIKKENIEISTECTKCNSDKYFSYRADSNTGRFAGVIELK
ncbi:peptidoglycan editing factor PgeF [Candidatus Sulfurimonas marisnigri]|uniref:Purine nucleoside phosphorylase n=1 Tax=Candidatus Sulfurimonas marisnigri TaxID=2740405 RepID=A0A7S7RR31_9BACT|nr:peptidoglycan editing factor PgeF [Candidatus Sulfurimonas marisnigri]QOY55080.1 peptidoglycan editing factor PgeF [Candidatus Sulfurimonas marisnigri]